MVQDEKQTELCLRILQTCRAELCDPVSYTHLTLPTTERV